MKMSCYKCGVEISLPGNDKPRRQDLCPKCSAPLHCCRNCRFYDPKAYHQCREPQAEWVRDKEIANFCEYFELGKGKTDQAAQKRREEARKKLESLFKKDR
ncbi:hypothetical protein J7K19_03250 [bacterium]|nr:hypothetical protein [bacterium]